MPALQRPPLPLELHHRNPCRPPDWRWLRAVGIVDEGQQRPTRRRDGEENVVLIRKAVSFRRDFVEAVGSHNVMAQVSLADAYQSLVWAHQIYSDETRLQVRYAVEARLLARQTNREVAFSVGSTEDIIDIYEQLFFAVRDRLCYPDYIFQSVLGAELHGRLSTMDYGMLWKLFAYIGGPYVLEAIIRRVANPSWVSSPEEVLSFFHDTAVGTMKKQASMAAAIIPINNETNIAILEAFVRYVEVERSTDGAGQAENQLRGNLSQMLTSLSFSVGTHKGVIEQHGSQVFDTSAVELRNDELMTLAAGQQLPNHEQLLALTFPAASNEG